MARPQTLHDALPSLWRIVHFFWPQIRKQRVLIAGSSLALIAETGLRLLEPWPLKFVFDRVIAGEGAGNTSRLPAMDGLSPMTVLTLAAISLAAITGLRAFAAYSSTVGFALIGNRVLTEVRSQLYGHLQTLSLSFHSRARNGDLTVRVIGDVGMLRDATVTALLPLLGNALIMVGMLGVMLWLQWQLALLALATVPLFWISSARLGRRLREVSRTQRQRDGAMAATAAESIAAIKVVQALSLEGAFARAFAGHNKRSLKEGVRASRLSASLERTTDVLTAVATGLVLWYGARLVLRGAITPGDLLVFLAYLKNAFRPVRDMAKYTARLAKAAAAGERVIDVFERAPEVRDLPGAVPAPPFQGAVRFERVGFAYESGRRVLEAIDLDVRPGQRVALVGPSGSGKSTLVGLILRLYDPIEGRVLIDGRDVRDYTLASLRAQISVVLQDTLLFAATVRENIAYGAPDATTEAIEAAARLANAHDFIAAQPQGYDTVLGERGLTLSTGQRQRIAIARAAVRRAPIVLLDEPATGLDEENERAVTDALERLSRGRTTFLVTHDLSLTVSADQILYLENGRVRERGTHHELMQANGRYAALYWIQLATGEHTPPAQEPYALAR